MESRCITFTYPKHRFQPEDLLHFIESSSFTESWAAAGLDDEDDLTSLQLCIMANPYGDEVISGTGGLIRHCHSFDWASDKRTVDVYYAYFEDYGIVYLDCLDELAEGIVFSKLQRAQIRESLVRVRREIQRRRTIR